MFKNKSLLSAALIAAIGAAALASPVYATDGTINITGKVISSTCQINGGASPAAINVALPNVATTSLNTAGAVAGRTPFNIALTGCGSLTKATTFFEPGPTVLADGNLKNTAASGASGVEVQLLNSDFSAINLAGAAGAQNSATANINGGAATLSYYAQYYANAAAGAGNVTSSVQFTMLYQ
jgi:major type 1 subunit fimbrin (pilin)